MATENIHISVLGMCQNRLGKATRCMNGVAHTTANDRATGDRVKVGQADGATKDIHIDVTMVITILHHDGRVLGTRSLDTNRCQTAAAVHVAFHRGCSPYKYVDITTNSTRSIVTCFVVTATTEDITIPAGLTIGAECAAAIVDGGVADDVAVFTAAEEGTPDCSRCHNH